jgi:hypothetical protein
MTEAAIIDLRGTLPTRPGAAPYMTRDVDSIGYVVIHHTGVGAWRPTALEVAEWQASAGAQSPFPAVAYHLYVEADGRIEQLQDLETVTWHSGQAGDEVIVGVSVKNWRGAAICFSGNEPTPAQIVGIRRAAQWIDEQVGANLPRLGHRDLSQTECPGATWAEWRSEI